MLCLGFKGNGLTLNYDQTPKIDKLELQIRTTCIKIYVFTSRQCSHLRNYNGYGIYTVYFYAPKGKGLVFSRRFYPNRRTDNLQQKGIKPLQSGDANHCTNAPSKPHFHKGST